MTMPFKAASLQDGPPDPTSWKELLCNPFHVRGGLQDQHSK